MAGPLRGNVRRFMAIYAELFLEWEMFYGKFYRKSQQWLFQKIVPFMRKCGKIWQCLADDR